MVKKITAAGWSKDANSSYYFNAMNKLKLSINNYSITLYFQNNDGYNSYNYNYSTDSAATK
jgi:hypothetical protein